MVKRKFSNAWNKSTQPRKQRKYAHNVPLHLKQRKLHVHLSKELRTKYGLRNIRVRKGDTVKIMRGKYASKKGEIDHVNVKKEKVFVVGVELHKREGAKVLAPIVPSNVMITELNLDDRKRKQKLNAGKKVDSQSKATKVQDVKVKPKVQETKTNPEATQ